MVPIYLFSLYTLASAIQLLPDQPDLASPEVVNFEDLAHELADGASFGTRVAQADAGAPAARTEAALLEAAPDAAAPEAALDREAAQVADAEALLEAEEDVTQGSGDVYLEMTKKGANDYAAEKKNYIKLHNVKNVDAVKTDFETAAANAVNRAGVSFNFAANDRGKPSFVIQTWGETESVPTRVTDKAWDFDSMNTPSSTDSLFFPRPTSWCKFGETLYCDEGYTGECLSYAHDTRYQATHGGNVIVKKAECMCRGWTTTSVGSRFDRTKNEYVESAASTRSRTSHVPKDRLGNEVPTSCLAMRQWK